VTHACPACGSADTRYREKRGDWFCDACDHAWAGAAPTAEPAGALAASAVGAFISYGHADASALAVRLRADLQARGVHPVWLDSEMIGAGGLWTVSIENGIREADVVLAIMSPHSLRADSICHDEVALAVAEHKRVVPVRATADPALAPSLLLVRRSWVDFSGDYEGALECLLRALSGDESGLAQPLATVAGQRPLDFAFDIAERSRGFVGREWLVAELEAWLASDRGRAFVVVGEPGIGKSAIAAHLASRPDAVAVHCCSTGNRDTLAPLAFVANVVVALGARLPAFGAEVARRHPAEPRDDAVTAFRQLVVEPARAIAPPLVPQLVIVDALDEAATREGETIVDLIAAHAQALPAWLRLVVTSRPEAGVTARLKGLAPVELAAARPENRADLDAYLTARLGALGPGAGGAVAALADQAAGNFLYSGSASASSRPDSSPS
jgi:TIR domain/AAA ATPase domain